jgi:hypothetical protein
MIPLTPTLPQPTLEHGRTGFQPVQHEQDARATSPIMGLGEKEGRGGRTYGPW